MATNFIPTRESELIGFAENFSAKITALPLSYGLTAPQAASFATLTTNFSSAWDLLQDPTTKSPSNVAAKDAAKEALIDGPGGIRQLVNLVQAHPGLTREQKVDLRITVRDAKPTPVPVPPDAPNLEIISNVARTVNIRLHDGTPMKRAKPTGVKGATVFTFVGDEAPQNVSDWAFNQSTTKPHNITITFPLSVADGAKVWFAAFWFNPTAQSGPLSEAVSTRLIGGLLKKAA